MDLQRLRWVSILAPAAFIVLVVGVSYVPHEYGLFSHRGEHAFAAGVILLGLVPFTIFVFEVIGRAQRRLTQQNEELAVLHQAASSRSEELHALHHAALALTSELSLEAVLQKVVDLSRRLVGARYGALAVRGTGDQARHFVRSGLSQEEAAGICAPGNGGDLLRLAAAGALPVEAGDDSLRIPIRYKGRETGVLYLAGRSSPFTGEHEELLGMFAVQAAIAIENARLYEELEHAAAIEERERIAREMHDSVGQMLGYVNTKAQAVRELLAAGKQDVAARRVEELAQAAQGLHSEVRQAILGLRTAVEVDRAFIPSLEEYVDQFRALSGLPVRLRAPHHDAGALTWGPAADTHLLRIVQEALTNVRKHAQARHAWVDVREEGPDVVITVRDDGCGFEPCRDPERRDCYGIQAMAGRAAVLGALFEVDSAPGRGTEVTVRLPRPRQDQEGELHASARG